ncbi:MAG: hypothetical protein ACRDQ5_26690 [Sciscionella sp.]
MQIGSLRSVSLAYMERQTGLAFDRAWLAEKLPTYRILDPDAGTQCTTRGHSVHNSRGL